MPREPEPPAGLLAEPALAKGEECEADLRGEDHRREEHEEPPGVGRQQEDEPVALEEVLLSPVRTLEDVFVKDVGFRRDDDAETSEASAPAELEILLVEEELGREAAESPEHVGANRARCAARVGDLAHLRQ